MLFKHSPQLSYTVRVNGYCQIHGLYWFLDFIDVQQKRVRKKARFAKVQRWIHRVKFRRATIYCYAGDSDEDPLIFPQGLYSDVIVPEITFFLEDGVLKTKEDFGVPL